MKHPCSHSGTQQDSLIQHNDHKHTEKNLHLAPALWEKVAIVNFRKAQGTRQCQIFFNH